MKSWKIAYWIVTVVFSLFILSTSVVFVLQVPGTAMMLQGIGYPLYLLPILGWAKVLGIIGIWQTKWPFLREWAYSAFFCLTFGAFLSHVSAHDFPPTYVVSGLSVILTLASYALLRKAYGAKARLAPLV